MTSRPEASCSRIVRSDRTTVGECTFGTWSASARSGSTRCPAGRPRTEVAAARAAGHVPDVLLGGRLIGEGPAEALEPVDVAPDELAQLCSRRRLPRWVAAKNPLSGGFVQTKALMRSADLVTVCEEAACPNIGRCWSRGTATFMIAGSRCTRGCRFCNVVTARPLGPPDPDEPARVAEAAAAMGLRFVVVTAVARDDLPDGGAAHFAAVIAALRERLPETRVEVLIPDLRGGWEALETIIEAAPDVLNHNTETVPAAVRARAPRRALRAHAGAAGPLGGLRADDQERDHGGPRRGAPRGGAGLRRPRLGGLRPRDRGPVPAPLARPPAGRALLRARPSTRRSPRPAGRSGWRTSRPARWCAPPSRPTGWPRRRSRRPDTKPQVRRDPGRYDVR